MALAEAEYLKRHYDLSISIPPGPLRDQFASHGDLIAGTTTMPLWSNSVYRWVGRLARTVPEAIRLARAIRRTGIELVLTSSTTALAPVVAARMVGVPVIVHARDVPVSRFSPLLFKLEGGLAHTVVVISEGLERYFATPHGARIERIADGIKLPTLPDQRRSAPATLGEPVRLCVIGGIASRKGQDIAVSALGLLSKAGVDATLDLVGREIDPRFVASVRACADDLGVADRVKLVGELNDVHAYLDDVDVVLAPSRGEWTPLALMEAMAHCKPVVAAGVGGVRDVVSDGETGLLVAPEDPEDLARAVSELVRDAAGAARMGRRGRESVQARFDICRSLEALETEIRRLLTKRLDPALGSVCEAGS